MYLTEFQRFVMGCCFFTIVSVFQVIINN